MFCVKLKVEIFSMKKAIVIGSTGLVGTQLIQLLLHSIDYSEIISLVRRPSGIIHPKLSEHCIYFDKPETWENLIQGDVLFSAMGTTIAQAKTKENQFKVDFTYQFNVAEIAAKKGVGKYVLISAAGANAKSVNFYSKMKGRLENAVQLLPFDVICIIRPGLLTGNRTEKRFGEDMGYKIITAINKLGILKKYRPIHALQVAMAMLNAATKLKSSTFTLEEVFDLGK